MLVDIQQFSLQCNRYHSGLDRLTLGGKLSAGLEVQVQVPCSFDLMNKASEKIRH